MDGEKTMEKAYKIDDFVINFNVLGDLTLEQWAEEAFKETDNGRHKSLTEEDIGKIEGQVHEQNTKKSTNWALKTFQDFLKEKGKNQRLEAYTSDELNEVLKHFYASVQTTQGRDYSTASYMALRAGINRVLPQFNIIADEAFKSSNAVFKSVLKRYRKEGKDVSAHHPNIPENHLQMLRRSAALSPETAKGLVTKVWFDIQLSMARRGREGNRELTRQSFVIKTDENGHEFVTFAFNPQSKNHKDPLDPQREQLRGYMYAIPEDPLCPVQSFKKYMAKCPADAKAFYLHPKQVPQAKLDELDTWYSREPMGARYLGDMLKRICEEVKKKKKKTKFNKPVHYRCPPKISSLS